MAIDQILPSELHVRSVILYLDLSLVGEEFSNFLCFLLIWAVKGESHLAPEAMVGSTVHGWWELWGAEWHYAHL